MLKPDEHHQTKLLWLCCLVTTPTAPQNKNFSWSGIVGGKIPAGRFFKHHGSCRHRHALSNTWDRFWQLLFWDSECPWLSISMQIICFIHAPTGLWRHWYEQLANISNWLKIIKSLWEKLINKLTRNRVKCNGFIFIHSLAFITNTGTALCPLFPSNLGAGEKAWIYINASAMHTCGHHTSPP